MGKDWWNPDIVEMAIDCIQMHCPEEGYYLAFSGGKDSIVVKALTIMAGVNYDAHFSLTTVDPPDVIKYVRKHHPDVERIRPPETMMELIVRHHIPPTFRIRYCCEELKERGGIGRVVLTGIRKEESSMRSRRKMVEACLKGGGKVFVNPIINWSSSDVWTFIREHNLPYCKLYDEGFERIGCIGCPMGRRQRKMEFERWPHVKASYLRAFERMLIHARAAGRDIRWKTAEDVMAWWLSDSKGNWDSHQRLFSMFE